MTFLTAVIASFVAEVGGPSAYGSEEGEIDVSLPVVPYLVALSFPYLFIAFDHEEWGFVHGLQTVV